MKSRRRKLREKVLQILYAFEMHGSGLSNILDDQLLNVTNKNEREFCENLVNFVIANREDIETKIEKKISQLGCNPNCSN